MMTNYIINTAIIIGACLLFYRLFLRNETFYKINRWILVSCIVLAFSLPLLKVPEQFSWRRVEQITKPSTPIILTQLNNSASQESLAKQKISDVAKPQQQIASNNAFFKNINWVDALVYLYIAGLVIFGANLLFQLSILLYQSYRRPAIIDGEFRIVETTGDRSPCSFGNTIFINSSKYDWETYNQILLHEKIHCRQKHSIDILLAELMLVVQWFNPFAWLYRKEVENNIEFLTDDSVINTNGIEKKSYQLSLLKVSASHLPLSLTINYNQSLLKKRIVMMNVKKSSVRTAWKYFFLLPLFAILVLALNEPGAKAQTGNWQNDDKAVNVQVNQQVQQQANAVANLQVNQNKVVKNQQKVQNKVNQNVQVNQENVVNNKVHGIDKEGTWFARIKKEQVCFDFKNDKDDKEWSSNSCFPKSDFPTIPATEFKLTRDAGTIFFKGKWDGDLGYGTYIFKGDAGFAGELKKLGVKELDSDEDELFVFFMVEVTKAYVSTLDRLGFEGISKNDLIAMAAMKIDEPFINDLKAAGFKDMEAHDLITARAMKIDGAYVKDIRDAGYSDISMNDLVSFKAQGIDKAYIQGVKKAAGSGSELPPAHELISYKAMKIDGAYVKSFSDIGYKDLSNNDLVAFKSLGITTDFIKGFEAIGYKNIPANTLMGLKSTGVKPEFIKGFQTLGFKDISLNDITAVKSMGITPEYVKSMRAKGFDSKDLNKYITLKSTWQ